VTDLSQLKEAIRNYREKARIPESYDIADALLDPSPISVEALKGMGFVGGDTAGMLFFDGIGRNRVLAFLFDEGIKIRLDGKPLYPQPTNVGQLLFLLLSLSEKESS
jgi:hypothetical protein